MDIFQDFVFSPVLLYVFPSALSHLLVSFLCHYHYQTPLLPSACLIHFVSSIYSLSPHPILPTF